MIRRIGAFLLPKNSGRRRFARRVLVKFGLLPPISGGYYNTLYQQGHQHINPVVKFDRKDAPLISIVVPAYNTKQRYIEELVYSIIAQTYTNWELVIVDASSDSEKSAVIEELGKRDKRIRVISVKNAGISANTNVGIKEAKGAYIAFSDHDDLLDPSALQEFAEVIVDEQADVVYSDEDKISDNSDIYYDPHFKPDWSPDLFTHVNYINHLTVVRKELLLQVGLLNPSRDGAQDYDLLLRVFDTKPKISHVPKVLYHWRAADGSTARDFSLKTNITDAASDALSDHFARQSVEVAVKPMPHKPGFYALNFSPYEKMALIIIPFASDAVMRLYNELLVKRTKFSVPTQMIVPEGTEPRFEVKNLSVVSVRIGGNYIKQAFDLVKSEVAVCISTVAFPEDKNWTSNFCATLRLPHVNAASPMLLIDGNTIEECGLVRKGTDYLPLFNNQIATNNQTFFGNTDWVRDVDQLSGNIIAVRTKEFEKHVTNNPQLDYYELIANYQVKGKYNLLHASTRFTKQGVRLARQTSNTPFFNQNLDPYGDGYTMYMPESAIINVMMHLAESEGIAL